MGLLPLIGMTALFGVIVNNSILLVEFVNESRRRGGGRYLSIARAGRRRLRPVLLTSLTTAAGILPMSYVVRGPSAFLAPMGITFGWGLLFGAFLTLLVVPVLIAILDDIFGVRRGVE
jgi:multidrug efflux pump subunit AcrB